MSSTPETTRRSFLHLTAATLTGATLGEAGSLTALAQEPAPQPSRPVATSQNRNLVHDVRAFGATGDGKTIDTPAINKAIEAVAAAGGGTVHFPAGNYLCYSIRLKSFVDLYLDQGATITAAEPGPGGQYDAAEPIPAEYEHYQDY